MFNLFGKKKSTPIVKTMSDAELAKYNPMNSNDPYVQYALTGNLEHAAKYAQTPAQKKAFADAKAGEDALKKLFNSSSDAAYTTNAKGQHLYEASKVGFDHDAFNAMMNDEKGVLYFK